MASTWPRFVWVLHPFREGFVMPEIWYYEAHTGRFLAGAKLEIKPHAAQYDMKPGDAALGFEMLARVFSPPEGFKEWKQPFVSIDPIKQLNTSGILSNSVASTE